VLAGYRLKEKDFIQQIQGETMDNNELINSRVRIAKGYMQHLQNTLDEINFLVPASSYLDDMVRGTLRSIAMMKYNLDVMDSITEKVEA